MLFIFLSGAVIIFTAIFSRMFVHRQVSVRHWLGIFTIIIGLVTVGVSDLLSSEASTSSTSNDIIIGNDKFICLLYVFKFETLMHYYIIYFYFLGDSLILIAQIITAAQMVYEEKYIVTNDIPPLQAVGWEGIKIQYLPF